MKTVSYYYPTSPGATRLGYSKTGCWMIERSDGTYAVIADGTTHGEREEAQSRAFRMAEAMPGEYTVWSMFGPNDQERRNAHGGK